MSAAFRCRMDENAAFNVGARPSSPDPSFCGFPSPKSVAELSGAGSGSWSGGRTHLRLSLQPCRDPVLSRHAPNRAVLAAVHWLAQFGAGVIASLLL